MSGEDALAAVSEYVRFETVMPGTDAPFIRRGKLNLWGWERAVPAEIWFWPNGRGYTGQETAELHIPGSPPLLNRTMQLLCGSGKMRLAEPGEFTLRAFLNGRLDLTQAEAVLGVIDAENDTELETALAQLSGNLGEPLRKLRCSLIETLAHLEAGFDFADEDIEFISRAELAQRTDDAVRFIEGKLRQMEERTDHRVQIRLILTGAPNSGKSSLFNLMTGAGEGKNRFSAIVSNKAGTTRDYLEGECDVGGRKVILVDTAGVAGENDSVSDLTSGEIKEEERSRFENQIRGQVKRAAAGADLRLLCVTARDAMENQRLIPPPMPKRLVLLTKADMLSESERNEIPARDDLLVTSAETGEGIALLTDRINEILFTDRYRGETVPGTAVRCRRCFEAARDALRNAKRLAEDAADEVLIAFELRDALDQIGLVLGEVQTDDILDSIFSRFCVGK